MLIGNGSIVTIIIYTVVLWCSCKIYKFLEQHKDFITIEENFHQIQTQITKTLIAQALIPLLLVLTPYSFLLFSLFVPIHTFSPEVTSLSVLMFSYIPMANALSIILLVAPYRKQVFEFLQKIFRNQSENSIAP